MTLVGNVTGALIGFFFPVSINTSFLTIIFSTVNNLRVTMIEYVNNVELF